jgi:hypothetical protein
MTPADTIIGWLVNGETFCPDCSPTNEEGADAGVALWADSPEMAARPTCYVCGADLMEAVDG